MTSMTRRWAGLALAAALAGMGSPALPQNAVPGGFDDLTTPDPGASRNDREFDVCPDRAPRPAWLDTLGARDGYRGVLLMTIYEARSYEAIVATGDCSCANRAPPWDAAEAEYAEGFAALDPQAQRGATRDFQTLRGGLEPQARAICEDQGNW